jgi:competence protein ComEC
MTATVIGVSLWLLWQGRIRAIGIAITLIATAIPASWVTADVIRSHNFAGNWAVLNCDVGQGDALLLRSNDEIALIDVGKEPELIDRCLDAAGVQHLDLLVLTHFDADHVGGIAGAISGRSVERALISGFKDDRPLVSVVIATLQSIGVGPEIGYRGMVGQLGTMNWVLLNPTFQAIEASDSNDASLAAVFDFGSFALLALGDLGESGQLRLMRQSYSILGQLRSKPLIVKVAHHGSADQSRGLYELVQPEIAIFSVGSNNDYGHPSDRAIRISKSTGAITARTDLQGAIAIRLEGDRFILSSAGKLSL